MEKLVLIGAGGYAKSVIDSVDKSLYEIIGFVDEFNEEKEHLGYPILSNSIDDMDDSYAYFISIGNNLNRKRWFDVLLKKGFNVATVIDSSAVVSDNAKLGRGCFVGKLAVINSCAIVGEDCIINTRAIVEHGCHVSSHSNISTNCVLNGDVYVGEGSFIGSSSVVIGQKSIGEWSTVGAGAVVVDSVDSDVTVAGVPAKEIRKGAMLG